MLGIDPKGIASLRRANNARPCRALFRAHINNKPPDSFALSGGYPYAFLASPSGKMILLTKKKMTIEIPPLRTVVPML